MIILGPILLAASIHSNPPLIVDEINPPPISYSIRNITRCVVGGVVSAEFIWKNGKTMVVSISGSGRVASEDDKNSINKQLFHFGQLSHLSISCDHSGNAILFVHAVPGLGGKFNEMIIVWRGDGFDVHY